IRTMGEQAVKEGLAERWWPTVKPSREIPYELFEARIEPPPFGITAEEWEIYKTRLPFIPYEGDRSRLYEPYVEEELAER
ncbi:unnamed protein product, partial [marine sediment metagenome]